MEQLYGETCHGRFHRRSPRPDNLSVGKREDRAHQQAGEPLDEDGSSDRLDLEAKWSGCPDSNEGTRRPERRALPGCAREWSRNGHDRPGLNERRHRGQ
jgi:hypothetical protein